MVVIQTKRMKIEREIAVVIEKIVRKSGTYQAHVTVPLAWLDHKVMVRLHGTSYEKEGIAKKYAQYACHVMVPTSWIGKKVRAELI